MRRRCKTLSLPYVPEQLERRDLLSAVTPVAVPWPEIASLRLSFVPDGTQANHATSNLFRTLEGIAPDLDWQLEVLRGFQTWAIETNANIGIVPDQGQPIGTLGFKQGDVRFGDVRIGAFPMDNDILAFANPYDPFIANTWVGDVFLNSTVELLSAADDPASALYRIMLHEAGHVFGMSHSPDTASPMFATFQETTKLLTPADVALLRTLYGSRQSDEWEGIDGNGDSGNATNISLTDAGNSLTSRELHADVGTIDDIDTYAFSVPRGAKLLSVQLHASGISLLKAKVSVLNDRGEIVAVAAADDPRANDLSLVVQDVQEGGTYYLRVESADRSAFGVGAYHLLVAPLAGSESAMPAIRPAGNSVFPDFAPEQLLATTPGYVEHTYYEVQGILSPAHASQLFRVRSPEVAQELNNVFTIVVDAETGTIDELGVTVTDTKGTVIPFDRIPSKNGKLELQLDDAESGVDYLVSIHAIDSAIVDMVYELEVDFAQDAHQFENIVMGALTSSQRVFEQVLQVAKSGQYHFVVSASDWSNPNDSGLQMRILDPQEETLSITNVIDGSSVLIDVFMDRGEYNFEFSSPGRVEAASVLFQLNAAIQSVPMGPQLRDTLRVPVKSATSASLVPLVNHWVPGVIVPPVTKRIYAVSAPLNSEYDTTGGYPMTGRRGDSGYSRRDRKNDFEVQRGDEIESLRIVLTGRRSVLPKRKLTDSATASRPAISDSPPLEGDYTPAMESPLSQESPAAQIKDGDQIQPNHEQSLEKDERASIDNSSATTDVYFNNYSSDHLDLHSVPAHLVAAIFVSGARLLKDPRRSWIPSESE